MKIEPQVPKNNLVLRDIGEGQAAWIPLDEHNLSAGWCLVLRTDVGYASLNAGFTKYPGCLDFPAIKASVKIVEDK